MLWKQLDDIILSRLVDMLHIFSRWTVKNRYTNNAENMRIMRSTNIAG